MSAMPSPCSDCGVDTTPCSGRRGCRHAGRWERYMVHDEVWEAAGLEPITFVAVLFGVEPHDFLCVGCLEARLGRPLVAADFRDVLINIPSPWDTPRLAAARERT